MIPIERVKQVLVVEDNPGDIQLIHEVAEPRSRACWHIVPNIIQACAFIERRPPYKDAPTPDLVILDLKLPASPGHSFIATVKSNSDLRDCAVVVFTSSQAARDRSICAEMGADAYIVKPTSLAAWTEALLSTLQLLNRRQPRPRSPVDIEVALPPNHDGPPPITLV
jgi:CheY-like chemotaxis protein